MKILYVTLIAVLLAACSSLNSGQETPLSNGNQPAQSRADIAQNSNKNIAESRSEVNFSNAIAALGEQANRAKSEPVSPPRNAVCPVPGKPCQHKEKEFADWELSFRLPAKIIANKNYSSAPFYALLLKTYESVEDCDGGEYIEAAENERKKAQKSQPKRKVFASYGCPNMDAVDYDFAGRQDKAKEMVLIDNFIAVYAGETAEEAETLRGSMRDEYPKAVVKRMTANWQRIEQ